MARCRLASGGELVAPDLVDVETVSVLRLHWLAGDLTARRFSTAIDDLQNLDLTRFPTVPLMRRAYELRAIVTPYDAVYVALAGHLDCMLVTADSRLAGALRIRCPVDLVTT